MNVFERQSELAHCRLDVLVLHDRLADGQRLRIALPWLNDHAEMDAVGPKRRAVLELLPRDRMEALACAHRDLEGTMKERGRRQNNAYYSIGSLQADPGKVAVECRDRIFGPGNDPCMRHASGC
jgi:hypothetical protein